MARSQQQKRPDTAKEEKEKPREQDQQGHKPHPIEWIAGALSALLVIAMIGFILYQAVSETSSRPQISVVVDRVEATDGGFRVHFRALNRGNATAAGVNIEGQLRSGEETVETREVTLDYLPAHSERTGGLLFSQDPARYDLQLAPMGYRQP